MTDFTVHADIGTDRFGLPAPYDIVILSRYRPALQCGRMLRSMDPTLKIAWARDVRALEALSRRVVSDAKLIGFSTSVIVPGRLLPRFGGGAFNFHPGPPEFPGNHPSAFAVYADAPQFGVTFHRMIEAVDAGEILDCHRFPAASYRTAQELAAETFARLVDLFTANARNLARRGFTPQGCGEIWSGKKGTTARANAMRLLTGPLDDTELDRRIRSFQWIFSPADGYRPSTVQDSSDSSSS
ncbi:hypothetical protein HH303_17785 [Rhodospirillaceae bacterium KN72]|uniref:Formyl transferase N-terminal domain-containing protein n=1 Tax=Pacificispira spongiicola TaxID=2729598 RepID=A0A7Y0E345_9PROT|nr:formyltransferase family protein [Pacificispira spongiicola]NMM46347.1 hypothetical protein [Pacificispira spongiicola]